MHVGELEWGEGGGGKATNPSMVEIGLRTSIYDKLLTKKCIITIQRNARQINAMKLFKVHNESDNTLLLMLF